VWFLGQRWRYSWVWGSVSTIKSSYPQITDFSGYPQIFLMYKFLLTNKKNPYLQIKIKKRKIGMGGKPLTPHPEKINYWIFLSILFIH
tara:strand:- start:4197 stop:4460 length:264 start_codon:yes stop_codon:yes gene_type:complete